MKRSGAKSAGFGVVEIILILVLLGIIGFVGWRVYVAKMEANKANKAATTTSENSGVEAISSSNDVEAATKALDNTDIEGNIEEQLNAELAY